MIALVLYFLLHLTSSDAVPSTPNPHVPARFFPRSPIGCFRATPFVRPPYVYPEDCYRAGHMLYCSDNIHERVVFSQASTAGFQVPYHWNYHSCTIIVETISAEVEVTTSLDSVAIGVMALIWRCVEADEQRGGKTFMGINNGLRIIVRGGPAPPGRQVNPGQCTAATAMGVSGGST